MEQARDLHHHQTSSPLDVLMRYSDDSYKMENNDAQHDKETKVIDRSVTLIVIY